MEAPIQTLITKLEKNGFIKIIGDRIKAQVQNTLTLLPIRDLIIRYRSILSGILNYYSFVDNRPKLKTIYKILKESLRKTIEFKEKIGKMAWPPPPFFFSLPPLISPVPHFCPPAKAAPTHTMYVWGAALVFSI